MTEQSKQTAGTAIASLVLGILGFFPLGLLGSIPAVICGHISKSKINKDPSLQGDGMALAGLIMGYVQIGFSVLLLPLLLAISIPSFVKTREQAQIASTQHSIRILTQAAEAYYMDNMVYPKSPELLSAQDGSTVYFEGDLTDAWGNPIIFELTDMGLSIASPGPDQIINTDDDITNK